jgi:hypothetical protein
VTSEIKAKIAIIIISASVALMAFSKMMPDSPVELEQARQNNMRIFCALGRQWVEFQNGSATWGSMVLDINGQPVLCTSIKNQTIPRT